LPLFGFCGAVSALACFVLVPRIGLIGAVWAGLASLIVQLAGTLAITIHSQRTRAVL